MAKCLKWLNSRTGINNHNAADDAHIYFGNILAPYCSLQIFNKHNDADIQDSDDDDETWKETLIYSLHLRIKN